MMIHLISYYCNFNYLFQAEIRGEDLCAKYGSKHTMCLPKVGSECGAGSVRYHQYCGISCICYIIYKYTPQQAGQLQSRILKFLSKQRLGRTPDNSHTMQSWGYTVSFLNRTNQVVDVQVNWRNLALRMDTPSLYLCDIIYRRFLFR